VNVKPVGKLTLKNRNEPMAAYRVLGLAPR
jgi:hypothetical protein